MIRTFSMAWRNMWRNWRRTLIALTSMVLGVILLLFFDGLIAGSDQAIFGNAVRLYGGNLQIHAPGFRAKANRIPLLPLADMPTAVQAAQAQPQVAAASPRIQTAGMVSNGSTTFATLITAIDPTTEAATSLQAEKIVAGRFLANDDRDAILIGKGLADRLGVGVGDRLTLVGRRKNETLRQHTMTVVGIYSLGMPEAERASVLINLADAQTLYNLRDQATEVAIFLHQVGSEQLVRTNLQNSLPGYEVDSWQTLRPEIREALNTKLTFTSFFGIILLLVAGIGIFNLMSMAVFERTREMGVLAALGMKGYQITGLFLLEGALIGVVGAVIGCTLGFALNWVMAQVGIDLSAASGMGEITALLGSRLYPYLTFNDLLGRGLLVVVIATLASLLPAWKAAHQEPAIALHHL